MRRAALCLLGGVLVIAALAASAPAALAATFVVSPTGSGSACSEAKPCDLGEGLTHANVGEGNEVLMLDGTYTLSEDLEISHPIRIGGKPGGAAVIAAGKNQVYMGSTAKATIHDVRINTQAGFLLQSGTAERIFVQYRGEGLSGCDLNVSPGATVTVSDSVCWAHKGTTSSGLFAAMVAPGNGTIALRNDTMISENPSGQGVEIDAENYGNAGASTNLTVTGTNLIARGGQEDIVLTTQGNPGYPHTATGIFSHSNYANLDAQAVYTTGTAPGTEGNQTALPLFANAAEGDFHELAGSPTLAAGLTDPANGAFALGGEARTSPANCDGSPGATDIGAYQVVDPPPTCPPPGGGSGTGAGSGSGSGDSAPPPPAPPAPKPDKTPPRTTITRHTAQKVFFKSSEPGSTFTCKLDKGKWKPCHSPYKLKGLKPGRHLLKVKATDAAGNTDKTPAKLKLRIAAPRA